MKALDLFAGMGGASLGLERAGFEVTAVEFDEKACEMHRHVCSGEVIQGDIAAMHPDRFERPRLLWASPPCQPFSQAGLRKGMEDHRAHLIFEVPRWVQVLKPRYVICEQVKAALPWWETFAERMEGWGYSTWTGLLHSEQYGVPQTRTRAFLLASLDGTATPPPPTHRRYHMHAPHARPADAHLPMFRSMADVIDIDDEALVGFARKDDGAKAINGYRRRDFREATDPAFTMTSKGRSWSVNTGRDWKPGGDRSTAQQRDAEYPAPSVTSNSTGGWQFSGSTSRLISVADGLALQTFPRDALDGLQVTKTAAYKAIGNAVPPVWAEAIARHMKGIT